MTLHALFLPSPVGRLTLVAHDRGLVAILWENDRPSRVPLGPLTENPAHPILQETVRQLNEYFAGKRRTFSLPLDPTGTPFQKAVWNALSAIPYGETRSYSQIAEHGRRAGGGSSERTQSPFHCGALPSRGGRQRSADGLRRRTPGQGVFACAGEPGGFRGGIRLRDKSSGSPSQNLSEPSSRTAVIVRSSSKQ